jgi:hypothetical protein
MLPHPAYWLRLVVVGGLTNILPGLTLILLNCDPPELSLGIKYYYMHFSACVLKAALLDFSTLILPIEILLFSHLAFIISKYDKLKYDRLNM